MQREINMGEKRHMEAGEVRKRDGKGKLGCQGCYMVLILKKSVTILSIFICRSRNN